MALVTLDDPAAPVFRGQTFTAIDQKVLIDACPERTAGRSLAPGFNTGLEDWRRGLERGIAGVSILPPQKTYSLRDQTPVVTLGRPLADGQKIWGPFGSCDPRYPTECASKQ
ncbi:hypothetical protein LJR164_001821 [Phenylobacterium sp. LjRoot164]|uniref:hypothetical protein n=1 Tax=unclassified Phenylobacterium TaxID=2640670 RepID=UPI003ECD9CF3